MSPSIRVTRSRLVGAAPDAVWSTLAAFDQISHWAQNVDHSVRTTTATEGVGAARRVQSGRLALLETITEWAPPARLAYAIIGLPTVVGDVTNSWQLEPAADGTQVTLTSTIDPRRNIVGRLAAVALSRVLAKASDALLAGLSSYHATATRSA